MFPTWELGLLSIVYSAAPSPDLNKTFDLKAGQESGDHRNVLV